MKLIRFDLKKWSQIGLTNVLLHSFVAFLSGCTDVALSGAQAVYNRQGIQKNINDHYISMQATQAINVKSNHFKDAHIDVATFHGDVLLAGQAPNRAQRVEAEQIVKEIPDVKEVYNLIALSHPSSTLQRLSDAWITAKVKAQLMASDDLDATQIKVITENGSVYLMGMLFKNQAEAAVDIASNTGGVLQVVKLFSYLHLSKK